MEYSVAEELAHAITHGIGVILSIIGLSWMLYVSINVADPWRIVASCDTLASEARVLRTHAVELRIAWRCSSHRTSPRTHLMVSSWAHAAEHVADAAGAAVEERVPFLSGFKNVSIHHSSGIIV